VRLEGEALGVAFAFANAVLFALYIVLAHRIARNTALDRIDGLGAAMLVALVAITPIGGADAAPALVSPVALAAGLGVGVASSVVPYVFDQLAMARLSRATYSLMVSLLPATATVIGVLVLAQIPSRSELIGVALVVAAVAVHREAAGRNEGSRSTRQRMVHGECVTPSPMGGRRAIFEHRRGPRPDPYGSIVEQAGRARGGDRLDA